jgi:hypothetical protein
LNYETPESLVRICESAILGAEALRSKIPAVVANLRGFSAPKTRHLLNNLNSHGPHTYLEIGIFTGSTFVPALYDNVGQGIGIDNYSQFQEENPREALNENLLNFGGHLGQYRIDDRDCFGYEESERPQSNVFFYDGGHSEAETQLAIQNFGHANKHPFILVVDDLFLTQGVRSGIDKAMTGFKLHAHWELEQDYHCGLWVGVVESL